MMARLVRVEKWHRDEAGVDGGEERHDVVEPLRREDRHAVAWLGHLLQTCGDSVKPVPEPRPRQFLDLAVTRAGVVHIPVDQMISRLVLSSRGHVELDEVNQGGAIGDDDRPAGVVVLLELHVAPFRSVSIGRRRRPRRCRVN